jgi:hypothetical protein
VARSYPSGMVAGAGAQAPAKRNDRRPQGHRTRLTDSLRFLLFEARLWNTSPVTSRERRPYAPSARRAGEDAGSLVRAQLPKSDPIHQNPRPTSRALKRRSTLTCLTRENRASGTLSHKTMGEGFRAAPCETAALGKSGVGCAFGSSLRLDSHLRPPPSLRPKLRGAHLDNCGLSSRSVK